MKMKRLLLGCGATVAVMMMGATSCDTDELMNQALDPNAAEEAAKPYEYVISVHQIVKYPRAQLLEQNIPSYFGDEICINRNYFLHSREIEKIEAVERKNDPGFYDLKLTLTGRGTKMWIGLSVDNKNTPLAFVIDGMYYRSFIPQQILSETGNTVTISGPFDTATALRIVKNAPRNYKHFSKSK